MTAKLNWGIIGTGFIAEKFAGELPQAPGAGLAAVGSRKLESAERFCSEYGGRPLGSYDELLAEPGVEAVYISLPNHLHHEWTLRALAAGKHVLCEKPIASNAAEAEEMFEAAEKAGLVLVEAFMYRCQPAVREFISRVQNGAIGEVRIIRTNFTFNRPASDTDARYHADMAGGSLMDVGGYCINLARALTGSEPEASHVTAHLHSSGVDDYAVGSLVFGGDILCSFTCGMRVNSDHTTYVCGSKGYLSIDFPWLGSGSFSLVTEEGSETTSLEAPLPHYALEAATYAEVVGGESPPWISRKDSVGNMQVLDDLRKQAGIPC